jgi:predicted DCC family thiol-disulfide oxidoreductase YuxK
MLKDNRLIIIYDGHCVLCTRTVARLKSLRTTAMIESIPLQDDRVFDFLPVGYDRTQLDREIHVIDMENGRINRGADAVVYVMTKLPSLRFIAWMYRIPGMNRLASRIYQWIAKHRYQLFGKTEECESGHCRL